MIARTNLGGGVVLPSTIEAGDTVLYANVGAVSKAQATYGDVGDGWRFIAKKAGTFRIRYNVFSRGDSSHPGYAQLVVYDGTNNTVVSGSIISSYSYNFVDKTIDVALAQGDMAILQARGTTSDSVAAPRITFFVVSISASDVQNGIDEIIEVA